MKKSLYLPLALLALFVLSFWLASPFQTMSAQTEAEAPHALQIIHQSKPKRNATVQSGQKITVVLKDQRTYQGLLAGAGEDHLRVDSLDFKYEDIEMVRVPLKGNKAATISGLVLAIVGFVGLVIGTLMFWSGLRLGDSPEPAGCSTLVEIFFLIAFGIVIGGAGLILFLVGLIALIVGMILGKAFKLGEKWRLAKAEKRAE